MCDDGFKDYIEKRSVKEIMEDYGEQKDEWKPLSVVINGKEVYCNRQEAANTSSEKEQN